MELRKFDKQDLIDHMDSFCALYRKAFTAAADREIISQRYLENPYDELLMFTAMDRGRIVANYSAVPLRIVVDGTERKAALSLNTMTDPQYAGKGLFTTLAEALYDHMANSGYVMIIGFPNYLSNRIFNARLGWKTVYEIPTLKLSLGSADGDGSDTFPFREDFEAISGGPDDPRIHVSLSEEYIRWRFQNNKEKQYRVLAVDRENWLIYQFYQDEINMTETRFSDKLKEAALIRKLISIGKANGSGYITTWCPVNTDTHGRLEKIGFRLSAPIRCFGLRCFDDSVCEAAYDHRNWRVQMGDDNTY